jgi:LysM repeat protein
LLTPFSGHSTRAGGQALLVGLMVLAFLVLIVARTTAPPVSGSPVPGASASAAVVVPVPSYTPTPSATPTPALSPSPPGSPSATPLPALSPTPVPSSARRYTVKPGDTLGGIAARFNTTAKAIQAANNIPNPRLIRPGQVLVIP